MFFGSFLFLHSILLLRGKSRTPWPTGSLPVNWEQSKINDENGFTLDALSFSVVFTAFAIVPFGATLSTNKHAGECDLGKVFLRFGKWKPSGVWGELSNPAGGSPNKTDSSVGLFAQGVALNEFTLAGKDLPSIWKWFLERDPIFKFTGAALMVGSMSPRKSVSRAAESNIFLYLMFRYVIALV